MFTIKLITKKYFFIIFLITVVVIYIKTINAKIIYYDLENNILFYFLFLFLSTNDAASL